MSYKEITGQPCSGKTKFLINEMKRDVAIKLYSQGIPRQALNFFRGIWYLGFYRTLTIYQWSMQESASLLFRHNIFRNAVTKFGVFNYLYPMVTQDSKIHFIDEGISHLPYLFRNTSTNTIVSFLRNELRDIEILFIQSKDSDEIKNRLIIRGHKRLKFNSLNDFVSRNMEIDDILLNLYPNLCKKMDLC